MERVNFTLYDEYPRAMLVYLRNYGPHFNKKLCKFATSMMAKKIDGIEENVEPFTKDSIDSILLGYNIKLQHNQLYDHVYVATMCKADFLGSSIKDEKRLALYVQDVIDDVDAPDGTVFNRWYADMCYRGIAIDWEEML